VSSGQPVGYAFVLYESPADAAVACNKLDGVMLAGSPITVKLQADFKSRPPLQLALPPPPPGCRPSDGPKSMAQGLKRGRSPPRGHSPSRIPSPPQAMLDRLGGPALSGLPPYVSALGPPPIINPSASREKNRLYCSKYALPNHRLRSLFCFAGPHCD
jgi:hypothetical protein